MKVQNNTRFATYLCCMVMMLFGMVLAMISPLLTEISKDFNLGLAQSGILFTISFTGFMAFIFAGGLLADKFGKKPVVFLSLLGYAVSLCLFAVSPSFAVACVGIFLVGGFGGIIESQVSAMVSDLNPEKAGFYINLSQVFLCLGALLGPVLGSFSVSGGFGWRGAYYVMAGLALLVFFLFLPVKLPPLAAQDRVNIHFIKGILSNGGFLLICLCMALYTGSEVGVWGWLSTYLKSSLGFSISASAWSVGIFWMSMAVGRILCGKLSGRIEIWKITVVLAFLSGAATVLTGLVQQGVWVWISVALVGFSFSSLYPFILSIGGEIKSNATAFSLLVGSGSVGSIVIPYFMGVLAENTGMQTAMMSPSVLFVLLGVVVLVYKSRRKESLKAVTTEG